MGSKGLKSYLLKSLNGRKGIKKVHLEKYYGKTIALDFTNFLYKFLLISNSPDNYLLEFINIIHKFTKYKINIIFIFDGKPCIEKQNTLERRKTYRSIAKDKYNNISTNDEESIEKNDKMSKLLKQSVTIKFEYIKNCKYLFDLMGVEWYHIKSLEADNIFKYLFDIGKIDACYSADIDMLAYGCKVTLQDLDFCNDEITEYVLDDILQDLELTYDQYLNACIASGTDYNNPLKFCKVKDNFELIKKYDTVENLINNLEKINLTRDYKISLPINFNYQFSLNIYKSQISDVVKAEILNHISTYSNIKIDTTFKDNIICNLKKIISKIKTINPSMKYIYKINEFCNYKYGFKL